MKMVSEQLKEFQRFGAVVFKNNNLIYCIKHLYAHITGYSFLSFIY